MKTAKFQYKCRLCGETYNDSCTAEKNAFYLLVSIVHSLPNPKPVVGIIPTMVDIHSGCKVGSGVSDLIGYIVVEE